MTRIGVDRLPSKTSASMLTIEAHVIAQVQAAEAMLTSSNNTLHLDGTRKKFREYGSFQISTKTSSFSLGISEMLTGHAQSFLNETLTILDEMSETVSDSNEDKQRVKAKLLQSISNMMTDRSVVNNTYCSDLEAVRKDVFGLLYDEWESIPDDEKEKLTKVNDLYCGLHVLANMATSARSTLKQFELEEGSDQADKLNAKQDDATSVILQCSKALTPGGDQKWVQRKSLV